MSKILVLVKNEPLLRAESEEAAELTHFGDIAGIQHANQPGLVVPLCSTRGAIALV